MKSDVSFKRPYKLVAPPLPEVPRAPPPPPRVLPYGLLMPCGNPRCPYVHAMVGRA